MAWIAAVMAANWAMMGARSDGEVKPELDVVVVAVEGVGSGTESGK